MFASKILNFACILLQIHWILCNHQHHGHFDPYSHQSAGFSQQQQQQNFYVPNNTPGMQQQYGNYILTDAAGQPYGYDANGTPQNHHQFVQRPTNYPTSQLWSSAPIVVADDLKSVVDPTTTSALRSDLQPTRSKSSKALAQAYNNNNNGAAGLPGLSLPSNYNYPNPAVHHNSEVWRQQSHNPTASPQYQTPSIAYHSQLQQQQQLQQHKEQQYQQQQQQQQLQQQQQQYPQQQQQQQRPQQQQQQQPQQHHNNPHHEQQQLHASNTDLNYLHSTPINHKPYYSSTTRGDAEMRRDKESKSSRDEKPDYFIYFKEYLRKNPRRIEPIY